MKSMPFHARLIRAMKDHGATKVSLAETTGLTPGMISHLTTGARLPSFATLGKLLHALPDVDARWLATGAPMVDRDNPDYAGKCESCGGAIGYSDKYNRDSEGVIWHKRCPKLAKPREVQS